MNEQQVAGSTEESYKVTFAGVGRGKRTWITTLKQMPDEVALARLVKKSGALMSRDIECVFDEDIEHGQIYAGMRAVGAFRVEVQSG